MLNLTYPSLPYPSLPYPSLPCYSLPYPTLPCPTLLNAPFSAVTNAPFGAEFHIQNQTGISVNLTPNSTVGIKGVVRIALR